MPRRAGSVSRYLLVAMALFMEILDGTIIATAAPSIAQSLHVDSSAISVTITAYVLTVGLLIPLSGWAAERFGDRRTFAAAIAVFTLASGLCAVSTSLAFLVAMRVVQGVGGALMVPVGRLIVLRVTPPTQLVRAFAYISWPALTAPVLAPLLGSLFVTFLNWRWIFLINVPVGVIGLVFVLRLLAPSAATAPKRRIDVVGVALCVPLLLSTVFVSTFLADSPVRVVPLLITVAAAIGFGVAAWWHLAHAREPLFDLGLLRIRTFRISHAGGSFFRVGVFALPVFLPLMFQDGFGWTPLRSGALITAMFVGNLAIKPLTTPLLRGLGYRRMLTAAIVAAAFSVAVMASFGPGSSNLVVVIVLLLAGAFRSAGFTAYATIEFADVPAERLTSANTLSATVQQVANGLGAVLAVAALRAGMQLHGLVPGWPLATYQGGCALLAVVTLGAIVEARRLPRDAGSEVLRGLRRRDCGA